MNKTMLKLIKNLFHIHEWQEFIADVTLNRSRMCMKCGKKQEWAGYWKTK